MKIMREIDIYPFYISFYFNSDTIEVKSLVKREDGTNDPIPEIQHIDLDDYAKNLLLNLETWIKRNLK